MTRFIQRTGVGWRCPVAVEDGASCLAGGAPARRARDHKESHQHPGTAHGQPRAPRPPLGRQTTVRKRPDKAVIKATWTRSRPAPARRRTRSTRWTVGSGKSGTANENGTAVYRRVIDAGRGTRRPTATHGRAIRERDGDQEGLANHGRYRVCFRNWPNDGRRDIVGGLGCSVR